jgi:hypothetical protein
MTYSRSKPTAEKPNDEPRAVAGLAEAAKLAK